MRRLGIAFLVAFFSANLSIQAAADHKRLITEKDLFQFAWVADPQISPDGTRVAYTKVSVNADRDEYESSLWLVSALGGEPERLTQGPRDGSPRWSPDGSRLVFVRSPEKDGKPQPAQVYLLSFAGGEPAALTTLPKGAAGPAWSPDGKRIAFVSSTTEEDLQKAKNKDGAKPSHETDVRVIVRAEFRADNDGYADPKHHSHIWTLSLPTTPEDNARPNQITDGAFDDELPVWSPDGTRIYFLSERSREPYYEVQRGALYTIPAEGGSAQKVTSMPGQIGSFALSRDGKQIAFRGQALEPVRSYAPSGLYVADAVPGATARNAAGAYEYDIAAGLASDQHPPRGRGAGQPVWTADGHGVIETVTKEGRCNLQIIDTVSGDVRPYTSGDQEVGAFSASADGSRLAILVATPSNIGDIFLAEGAGPSLKQLTHCNQKLFSGLKITAPEEFWYTSFDGKKIHAFLQKPPDFDPKKKYPLILNIHGGPHIAYGFAFEHEFQWMAAKGYLVLYPNPRGSSSYGSEFGNIIQYHYPGDDYKDLMAGVDEVTRRGYVDPERLGVTGGSGGGLLTNWIITQTDRFKAAVSQRSIADWAAWWYSADFTLFQPSWFKKAPFEDLQEYAERSPITHVDRVKTPLMLIEGEVDYRAPTASGGETMFRALKYLKKPVVMVRFPDESHELSRSGKPWHRVERLQHIVNWFDKYLQGKPMPQYDLQAEQTKAANP
jgi:dipeptidyl aminopeptidase/acylaminoacyl peptidase